MTCQDPPEAMACPLCAQPLDCDEAMALARELLLVVDSALGRASAPLAAPLVYRAVRDAADRLRVVLPPLTARPLPEVPRANKCTECGSPIEGSAPGICGECACEEDGP